MKQLFPMLLAGLLFATGCMKTATLTVLQPAQMTLPDHISTVAVVDRSKPANGWLNALEGWLSGEQIGQDRKCREEAVRGLTDALMRTPRFKVKYTAIEMTGSNAGVRMAPPLEWSEINKICSDYGADAVVTIESFDSNNSRNARKTETEKKDKNGKPYKEVSFDARQRTAIRMGWRLYDPLKQIIVDEFVTDDYVEKTASGATESAAFSNLPTQLSMSRSVAYTGGRNYGMRIAPVYVETSREYFAKAKGFKDEMKQAVKWAESGNWEKAAEIWKKIAESSGAPKKAAGRAAFNLALAAEMRGELDVALQWAEKSWAEFGESRARDYANLLRQRLNDERRINNQMNQKKN